MQIEIRCFKCGKCLNYHAELSHNTVDIVLKVELCQDLECHNCSKCDEVADAIAEQYSKEEVAKEAGPKITKEKKEEPSCADCQKIDCLSYGNKNKQICASFKE